MSERRGLPYWVRFILLAAGALGIVLVIVFRVFPQRFVMAPGLREQDLNFPVESPSVEVPDRPDFVRPSPPETDAARGPAERLWSRVAALTEMGRHELAARELRDWLEGHPDDHAARLEYARTLERAGRLQRARQAYRRVVTASGSRGARLALARIEWSLGRRGAALAQYDALVERGRADRTVRRERADLLASLDRHREAAAAYRALLADASADERPALRLDLARALEAAGSTVAAWREADAVASAAPPDSRSARAAIALRRRLRSRIALPAADTVPSSVLARARAARAAGDLDRAETLYRASVVLRPDHGVRRLELAELLATRSDAPAEAVAVLEAALDRARKTGARPSPELPRRLARYRLWSGDEEGALRVLARLAREGRATAGDLALLGDLYRWTGRRPEAAEQYARALARDSAQRRARDGRKALEATVERTVETRDPAGVGVTSDLFVDSDDYRSWNAGIRAVLDPGWEAHRLVAEAGLRSVRGPSRTGPLEEETGPTAEVGWTGWWRQATLRTALSVGAEHLESLGTEPIVRAELGVPAFGLEASYRHGPAHPTTLTFASVQDQTRIDRFRTSLFRPLGGSWGLWLSAEGASLRGGGAQNGRFLVQGALDRAVALDGVLRAGYATRLLTTDDPAPVTEAGLSTYWSPRLSWSHGLSLEASRPRGEGGWGWRARVQPGASMVRLHGSGEETELEFSLFGEAGLEYRGERAVVRLQGDYVRSRLGDYEALGASLEVGWRF